MLTRRDFLQSVVRATSGVYLLALVGCGVEPSSKRHAKVRTATEARKVILYDTFAVALYFDGSLGPKTGTLKVDHILADRPITFTFWHGHGGIDHTFTVTREQLRRLRRRQKVVVETDEVAGHTHKLFIDPIDPRWRVPGAEGIEVSEEAE